LEARERLVNHALVLPPDRIHSCGMQLGAAYLDCITG
jgi:hypothetical protein